MSGPQQALNKQQLLLFIYFYLLLTIAEPPKKPHSEPNSTEFERKAEALIFTEFEESPELIGKKIS